MSTDLKFQHGSPEIRLQPIEVPKRQSSGFAKEDGAPIQLADDEDECRTPTSDEHKIPRAWSCPPAPQKPKRVVLCKRKLSELQFFEIVNREEVESFFQSNFELPRVTSRKFKKRWCSIERNSL
ncbi:hypothetical protein HHK36_016698 [Tetracentron sinense]|uniref:Uncharacterized protein n=1 Tax=Tetracentron sinense TaxID=13715 RepID=A0A834Z5R6_TETSI|nr:hypothetical protein HHK36_016698 [Tetracentron sinense]